MNKAIALIFSTLTAVLLSYGCFAKPYQNKQPDTILVKLQPKKGDLPLPRVKIGRMLENTSQYSGIPQNLDLFRVYVFDFQVPATVYPKYFKTKQDKQKMARGGPFIPKGPDVANMPVKSGVAVLSGIKGNKKILICDANNDQDFSDDQQVEYKISEASGNISPDDVPVISVRYEYLYQDKIIPRQTSVKIMPFYSGTKFSDPLQQQLQAFLSLAQYPEGHFSYQNQSYKIALPSPVFMDGNYGESMVLLGNKESEYFNIVPYPFKGDTITVQGNDIQIVDISETGDWVKLVIGRSDQKRIGIRVGEQVEPLAFTALDGGQIKAGYNFKPYILLEFWGTWCGPCIAGLPALKALYRKNKESLDLISVAYDNDINKVRSFVKRNNLDWIHTFAKYRQPDKNSLIEKLNIDAFPTFILLDKDFNILARGTSEKALTEIEAIIRKESK